MKRCLFVLLSITSLTSSGQINQFPQVYYNGQGAGGFNLNIRQTASSTGTVITSFSITSKIGARALVTNSGDPSFMNFVEVCLPSTSGVLTIGYVACDEFYARINEVNNYATVTTATLNIRTGAGTTNPNVTIGGSAATFGNNSIVALTGSTSTVNSIVWYQVYLTNNCSQSTGWVSSGTAGALLSVNGSTTNYRNVGGRICDNASSCSFLGNINAATVNFSGFGSTFSSGGFFQYKLPVNWLGSITCTHPSYNTSTPSSYSYTASSPNYTKNFILSNSCSTPSIPLNLTITAVSQTSISLSWSPVSGSGITYEILKNITSCNSAFGSSGFTTNLTSITITGLSPNTTYYFVVIASNSCGQSGNSNCVSTTTNSQTPIADFYTLTPIITAGQTAQLYNQSYNASSLNWVIEKELWNGSYSFYSSSIQTNPIFTFNTAACYRITLTATNNGGSNTLTRNCYIYAKPDLNSPVPADVTRAQNYYTYKGGDPVNLANGSFSFSMKDFSIPGIKTTANLERRYFSNSSYESVFGLGWHYSFDIKVDFSNQFDWSVQYPDGHNEHYVPYYNGETRSLYPGNFDTLFYTSSGGIPTAFILIQKDGTRWNFISNGQITSSVDLDGNQTIFSYSGGKLSTVTVPGGRKLFFTYNGFDKVATVYDDINRTVFYYYDATGHKLDSTRIGNSTTSFRYGTHGMTEVYDPRGNKIVQNNYNTQGQVDLQYDAETKPTIFQYNYPDNGTTTVTNPLLKSKKIKHDSKARCTEVNDELNNTVKYKFSLNNTMDTIEDARGFKTIIEHDSKGNLTKSTDALGFSDSIAYTTLSIPNFIQDKESNVYKTVYSSTGNPIQIILPTDDTLKREYSSQGLDTAIIDARGFKTRKIYNTTGDLIQIITPTSITSIVYDGVGRPIEIKDSYGRKDSLFWNYFDLLIKRKDKMGRVEEFGYDENGNQIFYKDKKNQITTTQYNKFDKPIRITEPQNHITEYEYDDNQRVKKIRDPNKNTLVFNYDDAGRMLSVSDSALGVLSQKAYDANGNVVTYSDALTKTWTNRIDAINRVTSTVNPVGDSIQFKYNKNNQPVEQIDEDGKSSKWEYDVLGRNVKSIDANNKYVQRFLNKNGLADSIRDARGKIRNKVTYDGSNRLLTLNDGFGNYTLTWDSSDNVKTIKDPDNRTKSHFYNNNNELLNIKIGSTTLRHYLPDDNGQFLEANSGTQNATVIRNQLGWVTQYTNHYSNTIEHVYDSVGNTIRIIYPDGKQVNYKYNSLNKCIEVKDWANRVFTITRNNNSDITGILYANNFKTEITRDDASRVKAWVNKNNSDSIYQSNLIARSKSGNVLKDSGVSILQFAPVEQASVATYGNDDRTLTYGNKTITSNNSGQRTQLTAPGKLDNYAWSANEELDSTNHIGVPQYLKYDAFNERTVKTSASAASRYIVDHYLAAFPIVIQERNDADQELLNYVYIPGEGILLERDSSGSLLFYHHDFKGNTIALSNNAGQITDRYNYTEFADSIYHAGTSTQPYTWMGMYGVQHDGNELYYLHARYFDGNTGTFISQDPYPSNYLNTQEINRYVYGYNNSLKFNDPTGLFSINNISYEATNWAQSKWQNLQDDLSNLNKEIQTATLYMGPTWQKAMDHPKLSGFAVGLLAAPAAAGAAEGVVAFSAASYPGVGAAYIAKNSIVGGVYLYLSADGLNSIPKTINSINEALTQKTFPSITNAIYNVGKDAVTERLPKVPQSIINIANFVTSALGKLFK